MTLPFEIGAVMVAIPLRGTATSGVKLTHISAKFGLAAAARPMTAVIGVTIWLFGSHVSSQFNELLPNIEAVAA